MENLAKENRIDWIDMAKGYGMLFVIWAHLDSGVISSWMYTFHLPLFFFLSGYTFRTTDTFECFVKKKIKRMLIPYLWLGVGIIVFSVLLSLKNNTFSVGYVGGLFLQLLLQKRAWTLWFLACLLVVNFFFYLMHRFIKSEVILIIIAIIFPVIGACYYKAGGGTYSMEF